MKNLSKAVLAASVFATASATAGTTATAGYVSDYVFRGVQTSSGSAYASVDYENAGFNAGVWAIDNSDGDADSLEVDIYAGYSIEVNDDVSVGVAYTRYEYTNDTVAGLDSQNELGLNVTVSVFSLDYFSGTNNDVAGTGGQDQDYDVYSLTHTGEVLSVLIGMFDADDVDSTTSGAMEYNWAEISASKEIAGLDFGATVGVQFDLEVDGVDSSSNDGYIVLDVSKTFDI